MPALSHKALVDSLDIYLDVHMYGTISLGKALFSSLLRPQKLRVNGAHFKPLTNELPSRNGPEVE